MLKVRTGSCVSLQDSISSSVGCLPMSGEIFDCQNWRPRCYWNWVCRAEDVAEHLTLCKTASQQKSILIEIPTVLKLGNPCLEIEHLAQIVCVCVSWEGWIMETFYLSKKEVDVGEVNQMRRHTRNSIFCERHVPR